MRNGQKNPLNVLAGSNDFMHLFGHVCLAICGQEWLNQHLIVYHRILMTQRFMRQNLKPADITCAAFTDNFTSPNSYKSGAECVMAVEPDGF